MFNFLKKRDLKEEYVLIVASTNTWDNKEKWEALLTYYQALFKDSTLILDVDDPSRRKAASISQNASFIAESFAAGESAIFGEYSTGNRFTIENVAPPPFEIAYSRLVLTVLNLDNPSVLLDILEKSVSHLDAFYGLADTKANFAAWKKKKVIWGIDYARELPGFMQHTYFNNAYVEYFGADKFNSFNPKWVNQGVIVTLSFNSTRQRLKEGDRATKLFGAKSFVDHHKMLPDQKNEGEHVLSMPQLKNSIISSPGV